MIRFSLSVAILDMTKPKNSSTPTNGSCVVNISNYQNEMDSEKFSMNNMNGKDLYHKGCRLFLFSEVGL